jgi:CDP-diacylglycerol--glycerol-3-phosphate 3-phosphatidyltransferase
MAVSRSPAPYLLLPSFLFLRMALNALDGMLARDFQLQSALGAILNEVSDVVSDMALYLPFALVAGVEAVNLLIVMFLSMMSEFVGVLGHATGSGRRQEGPLGKSDRAALFGILGFLIGAGASILPLVDVILDFAAVLLVITIIRRVRSATAFARMAG